MDELSFFVNDAETLEGDAAFDVDRWADGIEGDDAALNNAAERLAGRTADHPRFGALAGRLLCRRNRLRTASSFEAYVQRAPQLSHSVRCAVARYGARIDAAIVHDRDEQYDYFAWRTMEKSYLLREEGGIVERPQYMWMRVALGIHGEDAIDQAFETYEAMSTGQCTHATPTLFNAFVTVAHTSRRYCSRYCGKSTAKEDSSRSGAVMYSGFHSCVWMEEVCV